MSSKEPGETGKSTATSRCVSPVFPLKHQHSFEERYAAIINQQILENTINKEALQRQVQAFFPFSRSASRECAEDGKTANKEHESKAEDLDKKLLQRLDTLDIKDKEQT